MLIFVLQTLAEILAGGTSLINTEQIDFSHPGNRRDNGVGSMINLYFYDIRESKQIQHTGRQVVERKLAQESLHPTDVPWHPTANVSWFPTWFDVSLLLTAWDRTTLGEHLLLSEALSTLLRYRSLPENLLVPELRGHGNLPVSVAVEPLIEMGSLWSALSIPLRPALYITVTIPFKAQSTTPPPLVWERVFNIQNQDQAKQTNTKVRANTKRVAIAGIVKNAVSEQPLAQIKVSLTGTHKSAITNQEGLFFFEDLNLGNYIITLDGNGFSPLNSNFLVDSSTFTFKEILLAPI
ncbi:hypothetical protein DP113_34265 (plasmid) [Brasilonema octagenarum UFV-E1]|uniref:Pvc16 N-terminal domain-containing protein n=1 Tax=Brasilonema sennae CENA114 TaxID=415709 RepID=A0A856MQE6_9CYAN|nr:Pvc16 family protein [Brasilonema sennae]QDL12789.1 hypothetical protein DP114_34160 [Brasilonema sennae CENA114]QDL19184.1 hypothetical protein DP113_34265 [Brasilonema octagenarum UFV-E1]